ncbi:hypothetical protein C8A00DRAFT_42994 [Chaetomidium leptoderma]|uniref:DUF4211 domain-containing protein n=1 Tax=Chaetomidium leptoderma TaxID=669021 RepID=A0AAN6ZX74_9PEZI|nr:hypothetical protein C8A00DRAFT_42994 [Chaetomidium leptoderma]
MVKAKSEKQQTLEATLGRPRVRPAIKTPREKGKNKAALGTPASSSPAGARISPRAPPSSFMHSSQVGGSVRKRRVVFEEDSSDAEEEEEESEDDEVKLPVREVKRGRRDSKNDGDNSEEDEEDEEDDEPLVTPTPKRKRRTVVDDSDDNDDDDDEPLISSPIKRRRLVRRNAPSSPSRKDNEDEDEAPAPSSVRTKRTGRKPLTQKEKARELLRRKRAGEVINEEEESSSVEDDEPAKGIYDTDSDNPALDEFEDDEEGIPNSVDDGEKEEKKKKDKQKKQMTTNNSDDESEESMNGFVVDDGDAPLGAPDDVYSGMPIEFTAHSRKPLKEHFRDAIEWLVQFKINPGFSDKAHPLYRMAWKKLDDEVRSLATSKFASSAWRKDFYMALRARPYFTNGELPKGDLLASESCGACGRSGHPARHMIAFTGTPYFKDTTNLDRLLQPVEVNTDSDSGSGSGSASQNQDEDEDEMGEDEDEDGNSIPKETKQWFIGSVCNSNAETAHTLMHWKQALLDWVDTRLHEEGHMAPAKLAERERMRPKKKCNLVDAILKQWVDRGVVRALYQDFKGTIETARNKSTTGRYR